MRAGDTFFTFGNAKGLKPWAQAAFVIKVRTTPHTQYAYGGALVLG